MAARSKFTRIPKIDELLLAGATPELIPTYCAISDYANNKNGLCWPKMRTIAAKIGRSVRTIQRHVHELDRLGLVEIVGRQRGKRGRFSSYLYRVAAVAGMAEASKSRRSRREARKKGASTTGHSRPAANVPPIFPRTKRRRTTPISSPTEGYEAFFRAGEASQREFPSDEGGQGLLLGIRETAQKAAEDLRGGSKGSRATKKRPGPENPSSTLF